jgi:hypothetical protein
MRRWIVTGGTASTGQFMVDQASNAHGSQILAKQSQSRRRSHHTLQVNRQNRRMSATFFKTRVFFESRNSSARMLGRQLFAKGEPPFPSEVWERA